MGPHQKQESIPMLFISHRHSDVKIANEIREWVETWSMGTIEVFQSSSAGTAPKIGASLNEELLRNLNDAQSLVLVYTASDQDWSYCMWECGVATDPMKPDTKVIVFQCTDEAPSPFQDRVRVNVRNRVTIEKFVIDFLTDPDFFPRYGKAVAPALQPEAPQVMTAADDLCERLQKVVPKPQSEPTERWPTLPWISLSLGIALAEKIKAEKAEKAENKEEKANQLLLSNCIVVNSDPVAAMLFGKVSIEKGLTLQELVSLWEDSETRSDHGWVEILLKQLTAAACWQYPKIEWSLFKGKDGKWYAPMMNWVKKEPARNSMYFDVHFVPFTVEEGETDFTVRVPQG